MLLIVYNFLLSCEFFIILRLYNCIIGTYPMIVRHRIVDIIKVREILDESLLVILMPETGTAIFVYPDFVLIVIQIVLIDFRLAVI